jgi:uncharacterized protein (DUF3820 family)
VTEPTDNALPGREQIVELLAARMPFGKYKGQLLLDLPEPYLIWFQRQGFPRGKLGEQLQTILSIKSNGLTALLNPLRGSGQRG